MGRRGRSGSPFSLFSFQDIITCVSGIIILITLILAVELAQRTQARPVASAAEVAEDIRESIAATQAEIARLEAELQARSSRVREAATQHEELLKAELFAVNQQVESLKSELDELEKKRRRVAAEHQRVQARRFDQQQASGDLGQAEQEVKNLEDKLEQLQQSDRPMYNARTADGKQVWLVQVEADRVLIARAGAPGRPERLAHSGSLFSGSPFAKWLQQRLRSSDFLFFLVRPDGIEAFDVLEEAARSGRFAYGFDLLGEEQVAVDPETGAAGI
jgi:uncharacterized small protein (DUF1192 family)